MEEISWGQRFFGYLAPDYFLEKNYQQEITIHNMFDTSFRLIILKTIIMGYGVILPLIMRISLLHRFLCKLRVVVPPLELVPSFLLVFYLYQTYPWQFTGDIVELMLALCFLFTVLFRLWDFERVRNKMMFINQLTAIIILVIVAFSLGLFFAKGFIQNKNKNKLNIKNCQLELEALKKDFILKINETKKMPFQNNVHLRIFTSVKRYNLKWLYENEFAKQAKQGNTKNRSEFFIDPWNMPYWVLFKSDKKTGRKRFILYSFGPNRKRDSDNWNVKGDDIGIVIGDTGVK